MNAQRLRLWTPCGRTPVMGLTPVWRFRLAKLATMAVTLVEFGQQVADQ
ncbi:hypothetical protein Q2941_42290 [Bradyrhizobium sp. UFLA05-153]